MEQNFLKTATKLIGMLLVCLLWSVSLHAQCDWNKTAISIKNTTCANNGAITATNPGNCPISLVLKKVGDASFVVNTVMTYDGTKSSVTFSNLSAASYNLYYLNGSIETPYAANPIVVKNIYVPMSVSTSSTPSSCATSTDGTITINVASGTGIGPFVYELTTPREKQTSTPQTTRSYKFNGVTSGETVSITVTDQVNGECSTYVTQNPVITITAGQFAFVRLGNYYFDETSVCDEFKSSFYIYSDGSTFARTKQIDFTKQPGNAVITVTPADGSAPYTQNLVFDAVKTGTNTTFGYFTGPNVKSGDKIVITLKQLCGGSDYSATYTLPKNLAIPLKIVNQSSKTVDKDCNVIENIQFQYYYSTYYYSFNDPAATLKLYKKDGANWVETTPLSGTLSLAQTYATIKLQEWGAYKLVYTDKCRTFEKPITLTPPQIGEISNINVPTYSIHGNTRGIDVNIKAFNYTDLLTFTITPTDPAITEKTFESTYPFSSQKFTATVKFPYSFKAKVNGDGYNFIADIPEGKYTVRVTDKCGNSAEKEFTISPTTLLAYNPKNTDWYENGIQARYGCSGSNNIFLDYGSNNFEKAGVALMQGTKTIISSKDYTNGMAMNNLFSGNYHLVFNNFTYSNVNYSLILKRLFTSTDYELRIPFTIKDYQELTVNNYVAMCDPATLSGMTDIRIVSGTPAYPIRYQLYQGATKVAEYLDNTFGSINHLFTGLAKGTYTVIVSNGYNTTLNTFCGQTVVDVVVQPLGIPEIIKSRDNVYLDDNTVKLTIPVSPAMYDIVWYDGNNVEIGRGQSIDVKPATIGTHTYKVKLTFNTTNTPCAAATPQEKTITVTVLAKNYWHGGSGTTIQEKEDWAVTTNWTVNRLPLVGETIEFATADNNNGSAAVNHLRLDADHVIFNLVNASDKDLIIPTGKQLTIQGTVEDGNASAGTIVVEAAKNAPSGTLVFQKTTENQNVQASVQFYNQGYNCNCGIYPQKWQYFGIPVSSSVFPYSAPVVTVNQWSEPTNGNKWITPALPLTAFTGYEITDKSTTLPTQKYAFNGILNVGNTSVTLTKTAGVNYPGMNLIGNSYTAAIKIKDIQFSDGVEQTVYLFNTGTRDEWRKLNGSTSLSALSGGTYLAVPQNQAGAGTLPSIIPSMHAFIARVLPSSPAGSYLSLIPYSSLVKNDLVNGMAWRLANAQPEPRNPYIVMDVIGAKSADRVWLFENPITTHGFDNGWDGKKIIEPGITQLYISGNDGDNFQVATVPELVGTQFGFIADADGNYILNFVPSPDMESRRLYLRDTQTGITRKIYGNSEFTFTAKQGDNGNRFELVAKEGITEKQGLINASAKDRVISVVNNTEENCRVQVYDVSGKLVLQQNISLKSFTDLQKQLSRGVYIVKITGKTVNEVKRVVVK